MTRPIVLIISQGSLDTEEIIKEIREKPNNESTITIAETGETGYIHTIKTKYFEIEVILYGIKQHPKDLPTTIADKVEGYVVYYDTFTKDYQCLKEYAELMSDKDLEFGYVICKSNKVTQHEHTEFLNNCPTFAIIELERTRVDDEDPTGFAELRDAFNNFVWSNVNCDKGNDSINGIDEPSEDTLEADLADFEYLVNAFKMFRANSKNMTESERDSKLEEYARKLSEFCQFGDDEWSDDADD